MTLEEIKDAIDPSKLLQATTNKKTKSARFYDEAYDEIDRLIRNPDFDPFEVGGRPVMARGS